MKSVALRVAVVQAAVAAMIAGSAWTVAGAILVVLALVRVHRKWLHEWVLEGLLFALRRRTLPPGAGPMALLELLRPNTVMGSIDVDGEKVGVVEDSDGMSALLELGDPGDLLAGPRTWSTLMIPTSDNVQLQLLVSATTPVDRPGAAATSYRQLTDGRVLAARRVLLVVKAQPDGLAAAVRRVRRKCEPCRPLGPESVPRALADLAHHDGHVVQERWSGIEVGGVRHGTYRLRAWPEAVPLERLLTIPCARTTISLTAAGLTVRLAGVQQGADLLDVERLDGRHRAGLAATLPLGPPPSANTTGPLPPFTFETGGDGLTIGVDRQGRPVTVRLFRPEPTRAVLVGDLHCAATIVLRALAVGAAVLITSNRPYAWEPFLRGLAGSEPVYLSPPGANPPGATPPGAPWPLLSLVDLGPAGRTTTGNSRTTTGNDRSATALVLREDLTDADADLLARADLAILQPLAPDQVPIAASALGIGDAASWLTRTRRDMVAVVAARRTLRWALLSNTPVEKHAIRVPDRGAAMARSPAWES